MLLHVNARGEGEGGEGEILPYARVPAAVRDEVTHHGRECRIPLPFPRADDLSEIKQISSVSSEEVMSDCPDSMGSVVSGEAR